ncbi:cyclic-di-AMP receptor [Herbivorax sp. ANBcel31]|uniref:cyclic-di-AMP receptor n=1 Tax=Herbivorax sp. ANBcel31 TaxID=3069754 RepID=UPI0027AFDFC7|nr:cyclic-di-AMP receptor [Herbivorax sp. ANBcel31]MDQ2087343.1 cyclic-di-AMP receptor [Herbivorax sp. ANBcel31]
MKLVFAVVHDEDGYKVMSELNEKGFSVTKLSSSGGFLRSGNTTLMAGVDEKDLDKVMEIIENNSKSRKQVVNTPVTPVDIGSVFMTNPVEVNVGGATIFVIDVEKFEKI